MAWKSSVVKLIQSVCSGRKGTPPAMLKMAAPRKETMKPNRQPIWNRMYLVRLSYSPRPSSTALTIVEKLSSVRIITAASLVTPEPRTCLTGDAPERASPVGRHGAGLGHVAPLCPVDGNAEHHRARGQEERCPVHPEAVSGVARVPDEQDREHQRQHGDDHVAGEPRGVLRSEERRVGKECR